MISLIPSSTTASMIRARLRWARSGSALYVLVFNCGTNTLQAIAIPSRVSQWTQKLTSITKGGLGNTFTQIAALSSGTGAVLDPSHGQLIPFDLVSGTLGDPVTLDGFPIGIITNKAADTFEVFFASLPQVVPLGVDSITTTGTKTILHVTSTDLPLGRGVSPDGTKLYVGVRGGGINIQDNQ